jgi:hypothetical protein
MSYKYVFNNLFTFIIFSKGVFNFDGVGAGSREASKCHCIARVGTVFRMKGFGSYVGQIG